MGRNELSRADVGLQILAGADTLLTLTTAPIIRGNTIENTGRKTHTCTCAHTQTHTHFDVKKLNAEFERMNHRKCWGGSKC